MPGDPLSNWMIRLASRGVVEEQSRRSRLTLLEGYTSVTVNAVLFVVKLLLGLMTGSISLLADAVHTLADSVTSVVVVVSAYVARRPADREHPFGHGRAELVAALVVAVLLGVAAVEFGKSAVLRVFEPEVLTVPWWATAAIVFTALVKLWLSRFAGELARQTGSKALEADSWHHYTDVIATLLVVVAMVAARYGLPWLDGVMGVAVAGVILWAAWRIAMDSITPLLGEAPSSEELKEIFKKASAVEGVSGVHDIIVHKYGNVNVVSLHVETSDQLTALELHTLAEQVQDRVGDGNHGTVVVHVDPVNANHPYYQKVKAIIDGVVSQEPRLDSFHDLRIVGDDMTFRVLVDIAVNETLRDSVKSEIEESLNCSLREMYQQASIQISFEPVFAYGAARIGSA